MFKIDTNDFGRRKKIILHSPKNLKAQTINVFLMTVDLSTQW